MREYQQAVSTLLKVVRNGQSLASSFSQEVTPLAKQITYGVLREYYLLDYLSSSVLDRPLPSKHLDLKLLLFCGIYSIRTLKRPQHASVDAVVDSTKALRKPWSKSLVNAVLRNYIRRRNDLDDISGESIEIQTNHPEWLTTRISRAWPDDAGQIFRANNEQPPMVLRINELKTTRENYLTLLADDKVDARAGSLVTSSVVLESPCPVDRLPGFEDGWVSIQDEASQLAAYLLKTCAEENVLDACAAPGGKACHLLEMYPDIKLVANDKDQVRLKAINENLIRLGLSCEVTCMDLVDIRNRKFDKILIDAPCSATGIIRRHPDIKLLRKNSDIDKLCAMQSRLILAAWQLLDHGGELLYSTCSVLPEENEDIVSSFILSRDDVEVLPINVDAGIKLQIGHQLLPTSAAHDGFYYAHLRKLPLMRPGE
ncbi:MAG: 16S rRNA (cytosine(967)-C(5))-methyltransferase RsmB [Gammaproteobacteria bacterium]|nr:16S rRNA (cytosine(967)-C(5))-methyltransferase RsmB [Gammaproteobacteria bacterium]